MDEKITDTINYTVLFVATISGIFGSPGVAAAGIAIYLISKEFHANMDK